MGSMSAPTAAYGGTTPLAALTSVFTPPCPTSWLLTTTRSFSQYPPFPTTGPASCDPPSWRTNIAGAGFHYYSPAICPQGFVVGPNCGITKTRTDEGFPAIAPGETAVYCVPSGLTCTTDLTDFRGGVWGFASPAMTPGALATVGPAIQIRWVEADLTKLETHPLTPGLKLARTDSEKTSPPGMGSTTTTGPATGTTATPGKRPALEDGETETSTTVGPDTQGSPGSIGGFTHIFDPLDPTTSLAPANTAGSASDGGIGSLDRTTSIVVIVVVTVVAGIGLWVAAFLLVRRYKKRVAKRQGSRSTTYGDETSLEQGSHRHKRGESGVPQSMISPASELYAGPPAIGSTPNPAELEGDVVVQLPAKTWVHQKLWQKGSSLQPPLTSPRSMMSARSARRTVRESFGEKVNDPAAALGRLKIPTPRAMGRPSPSSASPGGRSFWRMQRSPRSPLAPGRLSAQLPKPSPRSRLSGNVSRASTPGRGKPGWQGDVSENTQRDATQ
ncbi:hypothetical protein CHGG_04110 [Chaetomium globosum CBS 148.51]|uniref:Uncharacterized protein n=1 Tax=Chaetomium globosum (strain ATCC 6205 / CBS 148.51 / DSM 1962 / NBRC 6347 / NRRL 1970) TaxID=306901 RepID=Q2H286_CHAGB|nr:uncharacterized protein CHGG_04110 [Chaetomium globosum CBS 148.51]EAQ87491.1 hypothetical protein CHGG_04110 [Chaetomium globosum CBS 148.51]